MGPDPAALPEAEGNQQGARSGDLPRRLVHRGGERLDADGRQERTGRLEEGECGQGDQLVHRLEGIHFSHNFRSGRALVRPDFPLLHYDQARKSKRRRSATYPLTESRISS